MAGAPGWRSEALDAAREEKRDNFTEARATQEKRRCPRDRRTVTGMNAGGMKTMIF
jgi:hypothetical protein